jgi:integrase
LCIANKKGAFGSKVFLKYVLIMISKKVQKRCENFCNSLKGVKGEKVAEMCETEIAYLKSEYKLSYVRSIFTLYRDSLKKSRRDNYTVNRNKLKISYLFLMDKAEQKEIDEPSKVNSFNISGEPTEIINPLKMITRATEMLEYDKVQIVATGLCLLTGRRVTEIMKTAQFTRYTGSVEKVWFSGQLKKRSKADKYKIYTLADSRKCIEALKYIRESADCRELTNGETKKRYNPRIAKVCKKEFSKFLGGDVHPHSLRAAYGSMCAAKHQPKQFFTRFLADILGHNANDETTATRYQIYKVPTIKF